MAKNWLYTDLSEKNVLTLIVSQPLLDPTGKAVLDSAGVPIVNDYVYEVAQYSSSFACSEIPTAACLLAVGRNARTQLPATIHTQNAFVQMQRARVLFQPRGEFSLNSSWPADPVIIFEGFFTGFSLRKINGKVHVVASLIHWLAGLAMSSCLTQWGHVSNPAVLTAPAVTQSLTNPGSSGAAGYIPELGVWLSNNINVDLWAGIKNIFCKLASIPTVPITSTAATAACGGDGQPAVNDFALAYLRRIEGLILSESNDKGCSTDYVYGEPLAMDTLGVNALGDNVVSAIANETIASYATSSFWDKLVGQFCPLFGMAVVPMIETALVIADTPILRSAVPGTTLQWKTIQVEEYDSFDMPTVLYRPLRSVGVLAMGYSPAGAALSEAQVVASIGGCYSENSVQPGDGTVLFVNAPYWLRSLQTVATHSNYTNGVSVNQPSRSATTPDSAPQAPTDTPGTLGEATNELYKRYARQVYVNQTLRDRNGGFSGKLRFDIAPGSIVQLIGTTEKFIGHIQDSLGVNVFACVQRVTIAINAEAGVAGTTFTLSHIRTAAENTVDRTSVTEHPLFGKAIHGGGLHGAPLSPLLDLP